MTRVMYRGDLEQATLIVTFEAQYRGLLAPCVRFTLAVTRDPRNTRFWLWASSARRAWPPAGLSRKVSACSLLYMTFSSPRLCQAHSNRDPGWRGVNFRRRSEANGTPIHSA